jgi:predicted methyltransferase
MRMHGLSIIALASSLLVGCGGGSTAEPAQPVEQQPAAAPAPAPAAEATPPAAAAGGDTLRASVDAPGRRQEDRDRDANRKPYETMQFFGVAPGMKMAELMTVGGYYGELLARAVGPTGHLYAHNNAFAEKKFAEPELDTRLKQPDLTNVTKLVGELEDPGLPAGQLDEVLMILFYHDSVWLKTDRKKMNAAVFAALKPGGIYGIVDHQTAPGAGGSVAKTLHRVDKDLVVKEVLAAGFVADGESDILHRAEDDHTKNVFDPSIRGKTDQFMLRFRKPK